MDIASVYNEVEYYENGHIEHHRKFEDGKLEGKSIFYYENRKIKEKENYKGWTFNARIDQKAEFVSGYTDY